MRYGSHARPLNLVLSRHNRPFWTGRSFQNVTPGFASNLFPHAEVPPAFYAGAVEQFKAYVASYNGDYSPLKGASTKQVANKLLERSYSPLVIEAKVRHLGIDFSVVWRNVSNEFVSPDLRNLGWRVVHDVLPTNDKLFRQQTPRSDRCCLCSRGVETLQHLFLHCPVSVPLLRIVEGLIADILRRNRVLLTVREVVYNIVPFSDEGSKSIILLIVSLFKSCVWRARNEVKMERKTRTSVNLVNSFLGLLEFRGKVDLSRFTKEWLWNIQL